VQYNHCTLQNRVCWETSLVFSVLPTARLFSLRDYVTLFSNLNCAQGLALNIVHKISLTLFFSFYALINDSVSNSEYVAPNDRMIGECERIWKEVVVLYSMNSYSVIICLGRPKEAT